MSLLFWIIAGCMIALALGFVAVPLWPGGRRARKALSHEQVDVVLYRQRRAELGRELDAGLLTEPEYQQALSELDRQLLMDTENDNASETREAEVKLDNRWLARWPLAVVIVALPLIALSLYLEIGGVPAPDAGAQGERPGPEAVEEMVANLEGKLQDNPDNGEGWLMLGRSYAVMERPEDAVRALSRARRLLGDTPAVLLEYAQALVATREQTSFTGRPAELVEQALAQAPDNPQALWLSGMAAAERGEFQTAVRHWQRLLEQQPPDSENARLIRRNLEAAQARLSGEGNAPNAATTASQAAKTETPPAAAALEVRVLLTPDLKQRIDPQDSVFVFARAVNGPPMPLAVVRRQAGELPLTVTLDDSDSMLPGRGLSSQDRVEIVARISKSGDARAQPGDFEAKAQTVSTDKPGPVALTIDSIVR